MKNLKTLEEESKSQRLEVESWNGKEKCGNCIMFKFRGEVLIEFMCNEMLSLICDVIKFSEKERKVRRKKNVKRKKNGWSEKPQPEGSRKRDVQFVMKI